MTDILVVRVNKKGICPMDRDSVSSATKCLGPVLDRKPPLNCSKAKPIFKSADRIGILNDGIYPDN